MDKFYTTQEVADLFGKHRVTIIHLIKAHNLGTKVGRDWLLTDADIQVLKDLPGPGRPFPDGRKKPPSERNKLKTE